MPAIGSFKSCATTSAKLRSSVSMRRCAVTSVRKLTSPSPSLAERSTKVPSM